MRRIGTWMAVALSALAVVACRPAARASVLQAPAPSRDPATTRFVMPRPADARLADALDGASLEPQQSLFDEELVPAPPAGPEPPLRLGLEATSLSLPAGRSVVLVDIPGGRLVSVGVFGPQDALLDFELAGERLASVVRSHGALDEDGLLPKIASFAAPAVEDASAPVETMTAIVEVAEPVTLERLSVDPEDAKTPRYAGPSEEAPARPMVGLPAPRSREDGYVLGRAGRYEFARVDVVLALEAALKRTRALFRREPITITDISQWDGRRPALDQNSPRHQSHTGGRDVDIALPANDGGPSTMRIHCRGSRAPADLYSCVKGSARGLDALRLAFLLGFLIDAPGRIQAIFLDDEFIGEVRRAAEKLRERGWISKGAADAMAGDRLLTHAPWHTDHVHVRFSGERGRVPWGREAASEAQGGQDHPEVPPAAN